MKTWIPFKPESPKTRLSKKLGEKERKEFAERMLLDVYREVESINKNPIVLSTEKLSLDINIKVSKKNLTPAVNSVLDPPVAVVMSDLPLVNTKSLENLFSSSADLAIAPGRGGGTNAFISRVPFEVDYGGASFVRHIEQAKKREIEIDIIDSFRLSTDMDEPEDLVELLIHGKGESKDFLKKRFELSDKNRAKIRRKKDFRI